jgi:predicted Zn-ribbon and HTH transcriptional regulator
VTDAVLDPDPPVCRECGLTLHKVHECFNIWECRNPQCSRYGRIQPPKLALRPMR